MFANFHCSIFYAKKIEYRKLKLELGKQNVLKIERKM